TFDATRADAPTATRANAIRPRIELFPLFRGALFLPQRIDVSPPRGDGAEAPLADDEVARLLARLRPREDLERLHALGLVLGHVDGDDPRLGVRHVRPVPRE